MDERRVREREREREKEKKKKKREKQRQPARMVERKKKNVQIKQSNKLID